MNRREDLHDELKSLLGTNEVFFQAPSNHKLKYPAIIYSLENAETHYANSKPYFYMNRYTITYLTLNPDDELIEKILMSPELQRIRLVNHFVSDNIHHYIYKLYY